MKCRQLVDLAQPDILCRHSDAAVPSVCTSLRSVHKHPQQGIIMLSKRNTHQGPPNTNTNTTEGLTHGDTRVGSITQPAVGQGH